MIGAPRVAPPVRRRAKPWHARRVGYYMRYYPERPVEQAALVAALTLVDPRYRLDEELALGAELLGEFEINPRGTELFDEELEEQLAELAELEDDDVDPGALADVQHRLRAADRVIVLRVLWQGRETEPTLAMIDPLWTALRQLSPGLLYADGEGYYDGDELVVDLG